MDKRSTSENAPAIIRRAREIDYDGFNLLFSQVVSAITALQAQDLFAVELSLWTRSTGLIQMDVEHALFVERSFVRTWSLRRSARQAGG